MDIIERKLQYSYEPDIKDVHIERLKPEERCDLNSDCKISLKLVNKDGDTLLLIEAMPLDLWQDGDEKGLKGCFIRRFEWFEGFIFSREMLSRKKLDDFFCAFLNAVKFGDVSCNEGKFLTHYSYVWTTVQKGSFSLINDVFNFEEKKEMDDKIIYCGSFEKCGL